MHFSCDLLTQPIERAGRVVALDLLDAAATARRRLDDPDDAEALHDFRVAVRRLRTWLRALRPWLDDSTPKETRRRLKKTARLTGASRDAEVHQQWLESQRNSLTPSQRPGHAYLERYIEQENRKCDRRVAKEGAPAFDRAHATLSRKLRSYRLGIEHVPRSFAFEMAPLIRLHEVRLSECLAQVQTFEDAKEGHQARIAGKRLRYIVEPLASCVTGGERLVTELADLQDLLGDWHDADVFSATIARASAGQHAKRRRDAAPGRRALAKRLEERGRRAFAIVKDRWPDANAFQAQVEAIAQQLSAPDGDVSEIERIYLPARLPADSPIRRQVFGTTLEHVGNQGDEDAVSKRRLATDAPRQNVIHEFALTRKTLSGRTPSSAG